MIGTFWSLVPSILAITLALITKEVYSSLFLGVVVGAIFYAISMDTGFEGFLAQLFNNTVGEGDDATGYGMIHCLSDSWNVGILFFLVMLGTMVALMNKAGGSAAFANWAVKHVRSKRSAQITTILLGVIIFIDDYFNCLTVGSVMKPITDRFKVSKEKLAYLIDSTAAPVCIIAPISSWAAAVSGFVTEGENGLTLFCKAIPFNFYAFFTVIMMLCVVFFDVDFKAMKKYDISSSMMDDDNQIAIEPLKQSVDEVRDTKMSTVEHGSNVVPQGGHGTVADLIVPIVVLITFCVIGMIYSGGFFGTGETAGHFIDAFAASDASTGLSLGSLTALIVSLVWFCGRRVLTFNDTMSCLIKGFEAMVPAILILSLAWTLKSMTDALGAATYVAGLVGGSAAALQMFLPAIIFIVAAFLAFATGTSWGTFGILIPICIAVFPVGLPLRIISISACMAGAVCGDHISPISDTTIMASAGAQCKHVNHVASQLPYALTVASISCLTFIIAGLTQSLGILTSALVSWCFGITAIAAVIIFRIRLKRKSVS